MQLTVKSLNKSFGKENILNNISFDLPSAKMLALLGASGCGKSTILRIIAGLENPDSGDVLFDGQSVLKTPVQARGVGFVFQNYALFPHMTVFDNIAFPLSIKKTPKHAQRARVDELLALCQIGHLADKYPHQISGGQAQRVALARALASSPRILLLDEPFSALDTDVRHHLRSALKDIQRATHISAILVTHDKDEAFFLADKIVLMKQGRVEKIGRPHDGNIISDES